MAFLHRFMIANILYLFGLDTGRHQVEPFGTGLINHTWKITGDGRRYILQRINKSIFKQPWDIAANLQKLYHYLKANAPGYLFAAPLPAADGRYLVEMDGEYFRLLPLIEGSHTVDFLTESSQAYEAAGQFAKFSSLLDAFDAGQLKYTLPDFHNLSLRIAQFKTALLQAGPERINKAKAAIARVEANMDIAAIYDGLKTNVQIPLRVIHHDTKISNMLFDDAGKGLAVIDLDTVMPGYFISDVGDMMRTYLAQATEEEQDLDKIGIRTDMFTAIYAGYMEYMGDKLTVGEKDLFIYAGKFMIYMQAVRFLTDFLNGDIYYPTKYPGHNLTRAENQLRLLQLYIKAEPIFTEIINQYNHRGAGVAN